MGWIQFMGKKRKIKNKAKTCLICGTCFDGFYDKHIHRLNTKKGYTLSNTLILCSICKQRVLRAQIKLFRVKLIHSVVDLYFESFSVNLKKMFLRNLGKLRYEDRYKDKNE